MTTFEVRTEPEWRSWVTPSLLKNKPIHRWYYFPHSFTSELVHKLIEEWNLTSEDRLLDPFCGSGTTLVAAKEKGMPAKGYDLSPLAALTTNAKIANYAVHDLKSIWRRLRKAIHPECWNGASKTYPLLVRHALPGRLLGAFDSIADQVRRLECTTTQRQFFSLALLRTLPRYSRAVPTGGWLSWKHSGKRYTSILDSLGEQVRLMLEDVEACGSRKRGNWLAEVADARCLPDSQRAYSAIITSPPYPNRHDYTRVFGVELMFGFLNWNETKKLRYQSFHSHPEAHPKRPDCEGYTQPSSLTRTLRKIEKAGEDKRITRMLEGYFVDLYLCLKECRRVTKRGGKIAFVLGNAQYRGQVIPVDELTAEIGERAGLRCDHLIAVRFRGNSAQQMGEFGRRPSRESIVVFRRM